MCDILNALSLHNELRAHHSSPKLKWSTMRARSAQHHAEFLLERDTLTLGPLVDEEGRRIGQNIACAEKKRIQRGWGAVDATKLWYKEVNRYNQDVPIYRKVYRHFTQLVWRDTTEIGIGVAVSPDKVVVVANYYPSGNIEGEFRENVLARV